MANIQGWAKLTYRSKVHAAKISSHGHTMTNMMGRPETLHFTFEDALRGEELYIELTPQEVEEVRLACAEFNKRRNV